MYNQKVTYAEIVEKPIRKLKSVNDDQNSAIWRIYINSIVLYTNRKVNKNSYNIIRSDHAISTEPRKHADLT